MSTVCEWFGLKTTRTVFVGLTSKPVATVFASLASKLMAMIFTGLVSKPMVMFSSGLTSKPAATVFSSLTSKLVATISPSLALKPVVDFLVEPQNQGGGWFPGLGLKTDNFGLVICRDSFLVCALKLSGFRFVGCATKLTEGGRRGTRVEI
jgi:hypothetical protein